jgi:L-alanine-DL-glutamate epimerase-like enolase superfamily enzyme
VVVEAAGGGACGLGYTYGDASAARLIDGRLGEAVEGADAMAIGACWDAMVASVRNVGRPGIASTAISAVDAALWDLKARFLGLPLVRLLGGKLRSVPVYGSEASPRTPSRSCRSSLRAGRLTEYGRSR